MSKTIKKGIVLFACIAILLSLFAGCGAKAPEKSDSTTPAQSEKQEAKPEETKEQANAAPAEKVTLTLLVPNSSTWDGTKAVIEAFEKKYNIATEIELRPGGEEGENVVKARLATNDMSDMCGYNSGSLFQALNPEASFLDITNEPFMANVIDSFKSNVSANGKVFGVPDNTIMAGGWLYNKNVYKKLGLSIPKTWDELISNCEKIKAAGKTAVIGTYKDSWTSQLIVLAEYYSVQAQVPTFAAEYTANKAKIATTPAALSSFEKLQEVFKKGFMNSDYLSTTFDAGLKMLAEGKGAHYPMLTFALDNIKANSPDKVNDIGFFAQPGDDANNTGLTIWLPGGFFISKNSKKIEAALKWFSFYASVEGAEVFAAKQKPSGPFAIKGAKLPDDVLPAVKDMLPYIDSGKNSPALEFVSPIKGPNLPQICVQCGSGIKTPLENAQEYDKDVEKQAKQLGLAGW